MNKIVQYSILFGFTVLVISLALSFCYIFPIGDDYMMFTLRKINGFYGAVQYALTHFGGRYFSYFLNCLVNINPNNFSFYRLQTFGYFIFFLINIYHFFHQLFYRISFKNKLLLTSAFFITYFLMMFSVAEGFFWYTAVTTYMIANALTLLFFSLILKYYRRKSTIIFILSLAIQFLLYGLNEVSMLYNTFILFCIVVYQFYIKGNFRKQSILFFAFALTSIFFYLSFDGSTNRETLIVTETGKEFHNKDLLYSVFMAFRKMHLTFLYGFWMIIFLIPFLLQNAIKQIIEKYSIPKISIIIGLLIWIASVTIGLFTSYYGANWYPNGRMLNVNALYVWFSTLFLSILFVVNINLLQKIIYTRYTPIISIVILLLSVYIFPNNIKALYNDWFSGKLKNYKIEMNKNYNLLSHCKTDSCKIEVINNKPFTILERRKEQSHQFQQYYLKHYSDYFQKKIVIDSTEEK